MSKKLVVKFTTDKLKKLVDDKTSCVLVHKSVYSLQLFPYHLCDISASIKELLNAKVAKYDKKLDGILLGYKNLKLITPQGSIISDSCYIHIDIEGDFYIFKPEIQSLLTGIVNKTIDNHVGCLVHGLFNISVPNTGEENWAGHNVNIGDEVILRVDFMDLEARLPYIKAQMVETITKVKKMKVKKEEADVSLTKKKKIKKEQNIDDTKINNNGSYSDLNLDKSLIKKKKKSKQTNKSEEIDTINIKSEMKRESTEIENLNTSKSKKEKNKLNGHYEEKRKSNEIENNLNTSKSKKEKNKLKSKLNSHDAVKSEEFNESIKVEQLVNFDKSPKLKKKSSKVDESGHFNLAQIAALNESNTLKRNDNSAENFEDKKVKKRKRKSNDILENDEKPKKKQKQKLETNKDVTEVKKKTKTKIK